MPRLGRAFRGFWWSRLLLLSGVNFFASRSLCETLTDLPRKLLCTRLIMLDADVEVGSKSELVVSSYCVLYVNSHNDDICLCELYV